MTRMMTPGETQYRTALKGLGERRYEFDTGAENDKLRQAAQIAAQQRMADQQAEMQKWGMIASGVGNLAGIPLGLGLKSAFAPSATAGLDAQSDWIMKNPDKAKALGY